uniref:PPM-type phosphatase domain-containing protein n=1 Tax=Mesocestoides corti TaxID=53468 RepID=A0A5K3G2D3_MESCO
DQTCWTTWPQPIPCLSAIQWHARKESSQPEKDMDEMQYIMSGVASEVDSDGRARVFYSADVLVRRHIGPSEPEFQRHARPISSQPEKNTNEQQYKMSGTASAMDLGGRRITFGSGFWFFKKACSLVSVFFSLGLENCLNALTQKDQH